MIVTDRLKQVIFKRLYEELGNCEIIPYKSSIWFINRENKYWYFELEEGRTLWWRYEFFIPFFDMFSMSPDDFKSVLSSWVEEVLNCKVVTTDGPSDYDACEVEEVLNCKVVTSGGVETSLNWSVEEILNQ